METHIIAPPDSRVKRTAHSTAVSRPRAISRFPFDTTQIRNALVDNGGATLWPSTAAVVLSVAKVSSSKELDPRISLCQLAFSAIYGVLFVPVRVQLKKLLMNFLNRPIQDGRRASGCYLNLPLWYHNAVSFNVSINLSCLLYMLTVGFGQELWRAAYIAKQRCGSEESVVKPHGFNIVKIDAREGIDCWKVDF